MDERATVTESGARVDHMIEAVFDITGGKGSNFFLFAKKSRFYGRLPTDAWWTTDPRCIIRVSRTLATGRQGGLI